MRKESQTGKTQEPLKKVLLVNDNQELCKRLTQEWNNASKMCEFSFVTEFSKAKDLLQRKSFFDVLVLNPRINTSDDNCAEDNLVKPEFAGIILKNISFAFARCHAQKQPQVIYYTDAESVKNLSPSALDEVYDVLTHPQPAKAVLKIIEESLSP